MVSPFGWYLQESSDDLQFINQYLMKSGSDPMLVREAATVAVSGRNRKLDPYFWRVSYHFLPFKLGEGSLLSSPFPFLFYDNFSPCQTPGTMVVNQRYLRRDRVLIAQVFTFNLGFMVVSASPLDLGNGLRQFPQGRIGFIVSKIIEGTTNK